jgi:outer membrane protein assembly factor BamB
VFSPIVANGLVYVWSSDYLQLGNSYVVQVDPSTVSFGFAFECTGDSGPPAVASGVVYVGCNSLLYALDGSTLTPIWTADVDTIGTPSVADGMVYTCDANFNLDALNASTGALIWTTSPCDTNVAAVANGTDEFFDESSAVANGVVYTGNYYAETAVLAFNADTGAQLWSYGTSAAPSGFVVANGVVYATVNNTVYAFGLPRAGGTEEPSDPPSPSSLKPDFSSRAPQVAGQAGQD